MRRQAIEAIERGLSILAGAVLCKCLKGFGTKNYDSVRAIQCDEATFAELTDGPADSFCCEAQKICNICAAHRQIDLIVLADDSAGAICQDTQKGCDLFCG